MADTQSGQFSAAGLQTADVDPLTNETAPSYDEAKGTVASLKGGK